MNNIIKININKKFDYLISISLIFNIVLVMYWNDIRHIDITGEITTSIKLNKKQLQYLDKNIENINLNINDEIKSTKLISSQKNPEIKFYLDKYNNVSIKYDASNGGIITLNNYLLKKLAWNELKNIENKKDIHVSTFPKNIIGNSYKFPSELSHKILVFHILFSLLFAIIIFLRKK